MTDLVERLRHYIGWRSDAFRSECDDLTWPKPVDIKLAEEAASRISQQDAELERLRLELADMTISRDGYAKQAMAREAEGRRKAFIEAAEIAGQDRTPGYGPHRDDMEYLADAQRRNIAERIRAKAEETGR